MMTRNYEAEYEDLSYVMGANDGGIKRGDRGETGDNEARPTAGADEKGSGHSGGEGTGGHVTADPSSSGAGTTGED